MFLAYRNEDDKRKSSTEKVVRKQSEKHIRKRVKMIEICDLKR